MSLKLAIAEIHVNWLRVTTFGNRLLPSQLLKYLKLTRILQLSNQVVKREFLIGQASISRVFHPLCKGRNPVDKRQIRGRRYLGLVFR